jgi:tetratricopeptide (TPR) repeat protein
MEKIIKFLKRLVKVPDNNVPLRIEAGSNSNLNNHPHNFSNKQIPNYFYERAHIYEKLAEFSKSIDDIKTAIQMDPDNANYYWELGGYLVSNEMVLHGKITGETSKKVLEDAANNYRISLRKDPINQCAWINLIEINLFLKNWDEAISHYGSSKTYFKSLSFQLIGSFLGSLALILSGEEVDIDDLQLLNETSIRISNDNYRVSEIESMIFELEESGVCTLIILKAIEIYKLFITHYDEEPLRYGSQNKRWDIYKTKFKTIYLSE